MTNVRSNLSVGLLLATLSLGACADSSDDDDDKPSNSTTLDASAAAPSNPSGSGLDAGAANPLGDLGSLFADGGFDIGAISGTACSLAPQFCMDGSIVIPEGGLGALGDLFNRDGGRPRERDAGASDAGAIASDSGASDSGASDSGTSDSGPVTSDAGADAN